MSEGKLSAQIASQPPTFSKNIKKNKHIQKNLNVFIQFIKLCYYNQILNSIKRQPPCKSELCGHAIKQTTHKSLL